MFVSSTVSLTKMHFASKACEYSDLGTTATIVSWYSSGMLRVTDSSGKMVCGLEEILQREGVEDIGEK